jgi:plasmid replication initiation protein
MNNAGKQGREPKQIVRLTAYDLLVCTNRSTGQRGYNLLKQAFQRLQGVSIITNITTGGVRVNKGFGLIECKYSVNPSLGMTRH